MRIKLLSDLHFEHYKGVEEFISSLDREVDLLVLAGDIDVHPGIESTLAAFCSEFRQVLFVPGNHEYYPTYPLTFDATLQKIEASFANLTALYSGRRSSVIDGIRFHGSTGWFREDPFSASFARRVSDFTQIKSFVPWVYEEQQAFEAYLQENLASADVVVTHHLPSPICIADRFKTSTLNRFFVCDYSKLILDRQPRLWMFGHTHYAFDGLLGNTRLVCNPRGYPKEMNTGFDPNKVIQVVNEDLENDERRVQDDSSRPALDGEGRR